MDFEISYAGKKPAGDILSGAAAKPVHKLDVSRGDSSWRHRIYCGDNLPVLRYLLQDDEVAGKVTLIYIDPPFATGAFFECREARQAYDDTLRGSVFLEFLRERVIVLRELLADHGSMYLHLDAKMAFPMKVVMDEIFGARNFRNWITRKKSNRKNYTRNQYGNISDYILFYTKTGDYKWNRPYEPWDDKNPPQEYRYTEEGTGRRYMKVPIHAPGTRNGATGQLWRGMSPPPGKHWQLPPQKLEELDARGEIAWSPNGNPRRKVYLDRSRGIPVQDIWMGFRDAHNQYIDVTGYPTEKNLDMLRRVIAASSQEGDLVLDAFMGSGTTLVAAEESKRRWVGIDASVGAVETTLKRLAHGSEPTGDFVRGNLGRNGKRPFAQGVLASNLSVYVSAGAVPAAPSRAKQRQWSALFDPHTPPEAASSHGA